MLMVQKKSIKICDRGMKDTFMAAEKEVLCTHGLEPGNGNFLVVVVFQMGGYWCHVLNMRKEQAEGAFAALKDRFGGGDLTVS
jgi:hypothetical protein